jgi:hypothetical protein
MREAPFFSFSFSDSVVLLFSHSLKPFDFWKSIPSSLAPIARSWSSAPPSFAEPWPNRDVSLVLELPVNAERPRQTLLRHAGGDSEIREPAISVPKLTAAWERSFLNLTMTL